ncbi:ATP-binding protein [Actinoplanes sp. NPDC024001]|uniref:ATP-binding protein n=1 Tax=Actinoplanes sp. NPDC024001 TaxID=3154598 RepID=UPI0033F3F956
MIWTAGSRRRSRWRSTGRSRRRSRTRHARAGAVLVRVSSSGGAVVVEVTDDGVGGPITPGVGLSSLRRRASELGGSLQVSTRDGQGTRLCLQLPTQRAAR